MFWSHLPRIGNEIWTHSWVAQLSLAEHPKEKRTMQSAGEVEQVSRGGDADGCFPMLQP